MAAVVLNACVNADRGAGNPVSSSEIELSATENAYLTAYSADIQQTFYGGYDGFDRPEAARERTYHLARQNQGGFWSIDQTYASPEAPLGEPASLDVARAAFLGPGNLSVTARTGETLTPPDSATLASGMKLADANDPMQPWGVSAFTRLGRLASNRGLSESRRASAGLPASPPDRLVTGPAARERMSEQLRRDYRRVDEGSSPGRSRYERVKGGRRLLIDVDEAFGTVVREELQQDGRRISETIRDYRLVGNSAVLERQTTVLFDASGAPRERFEHRVRNLQPERSR